MRVKKILISLMNTELFVVEMEKSFNLTPFSWVIPKMLLKSKREVR